MSYNIDSIEILNQKDFTITPEAMAEFDPSDGWIAESWEGDHADVLTSIKRNSFPWSGECSGHGEGNLIALLELFTGEADLALCWEGGDSYSGLRVRNGIVTKHKIVMALGDEESC